MSEYFFIVLVMIILFTVIHYWYSRFGDDGRKKALRNADIASISGSLEALRNARNTTYSLLSDMNLKLQRIVDQIEITNRWLKLQNSIAETTEKEIIAGHKLIARSDASNATRVKKAIEEGFGSLAPARVDRPVTPKIDKDTLTEYVFGAPDAVAPAKKRRGRPPKVKKG